MKRDIQISYSVIDRMIAKLKKYQKALTEIEKTIHENQRVLADQKGEAFANLEKCRKEIEKRIKKQKQEVDDLYTILQDYLADMEKYIHPKNRSRMVRVDRGDIKFYLGDMEVQVKKVYTHTASNNPRLHARASAASYGQKELDDPEAIENRRKMDDIEQVLIPAFRKTAEAHFREMRKIYEKKAIPFEETDEQYAKKAAKLYSKYSNFGEAILDSFHDGNAAMKDTGLGIWSGAKDLVVGVVTLVYGLERHRLASDILVIAKITGLTPPNWAEEVVTNTASTLVSILHDPMVIVYGIRKDITNAWDEKGIAYVGGRTIFEIAALLAPGGIATKAGKVGEAGKVGKVAELADGIKIAEVAGDSKVGKVVETIVDGRKAVKTEIFLPPKPHINRTAGHWDTILKKVEEMQKSGDYVKIYVNKGIHNEIPSAPINRRPDIYGVRHDGKIDQIEVPSKTDSYDGLMKRLKNTQKMLKERAGSIEVLPIEKRK